MTKADLVNEIARKLGVERATVQHMLEAFMDSVSDAMVRGESVYLRGFGSFIVKQRAEKIARNISQSTPLRIPAHKVPSFKPSKLLVAKVRGSEHHQ